MNNYFNYDPELFKKGFKCNLKYEKLVGEIEKEGYTIIRNFFNEDLILNLRDEFEKIYSNEGTLAGIEVSQTKGIRRLSNLVNKSKIFKYLYLNEVLLTMVLLILKKPFKLSSLNGHDPLKGNGLQPLHPDWKYTYDGKNYVVNSIWMLDKFTIENGATRVIPESHTFKKNIDEVIKNKIEDNANQKFLEGNPGDLAIYNSHLWHGGYLNISGEKRRAFHCYYVSRTHPQQTNQQKYLSESTINTLNILEKYILDVN